MSMYINICVSVRMLESVSSFYFFFFFDFLCFFSLMTFIDFCHRSRFHVMPSTILVAHSLSLSISFSSRWQCVVERKGFRAIRTIRTSHNNQKKNNNNNEIYHENRLCVRFSFFSRSISMYLFIRNDTLSYNFMLIL